MLRSLATPMIRPRRPARIPDIVPTSAREHSTCLRTTRPSRGPACVTSATIGWTPPAGGALQSWHRSTVPDEESTHGRTQSNCSRPSPTRTASRATRATSPVCSPRTLEPLVDRVVGGHDGQRHRHPRRRRPHHHDRRPHGRDRRHGEVHRREGLPALRAARRLVRPDAAGPARLRPHPRGPRHRGHRLQAAAHHGRRRPQEAGAHQGDVHRHRRHQRRRRGRPGRSDRLAR